MSILDVRIAKAGNAHAHFAALGQIQMPIAALSLLAIMARLLIISYDP
jgi:hypothetical protein